MNAACGRCHPSPADENVNVSGFSKALGAEEPRCLSQLILTSSMSRTASLARAAAKRLKRARAPCFQKVLFPVVLLFFPLRSGWAPKTMVLELSPRLVPGPQAVSPAVPPQGWHSAALSPNPREGCSAPGRALSQLQRRSRARCSGKRGAPAPRCRPEANERVNPAVLRVSKVVQETCSRFLCQSATV